MDQVCPTLGKLTRWITGLIGWMQGELFRQVLVKLARQIWVTVEYLNLCVHITVLRDIPRSQTWYIRYPSDLFSMKHLNIWNQIQLIHLMQQCRNLSPWPLHTGKDPQCHIIVICHYLPYYFSLNKTIFFVYSINNIEVQNASLTVRATCTNLFCHFQQDQWWLVISVSVVVMCNDLWMSGVVKRHNDLRLYI